MVKTKEEVLTNPTIIEKGGEKIDKEKVETELTPRQEKFCELYTCSEEFYGNGVQAYLEIYDIDKSKPNWYKTACAGASQLLSNIKVCTRINELLEEQGLNDGFVDKQLLHLITQFSDNTNKLGAIKEYNKLKSRITDKMETVVKVVTSEEIDKMELAKLVEAQNKILNPEK